MDWLSNGDWEIDWLCVIGALNPNGAAKLFEHRLHSEKLRSNQIGLFFAWVAVHLDARSIAKLGVSKADDFFQSLYLIVSQFDLQPACVVEFHGSGRLQHADVVDVLHQGFADQWER